MTLQSTLNRKDALSCVCTKRRGGQLEKTDASDGPFRGAERGRQTVRQLRRAGGKKADGTRPPSVRAADGAPNESGQIRQAAVTPRIELRRGKSAESASSALDLWAQCYKTVYRSNLPPFHGNTLILCYKAALPWYLL
jgi:hypothetical protein